MLKLTQLCKDIAIKNVRLIQTTNVTMFDREWRRVNKLSKNPNAESPLTYLPDFSYMDGRPTPIGTRMKHRLRKHKRYAKQMVQGIYEIDYAEKRYVRLQQEEEDRKKAIMDGKLRPKGFELLKEK